MLSPEKNQKLVRVGANTPMGDLMRLYWLPFLFSRDVVVDGTPQRVRLLGEDLVAFRDTEGRVGLVDHACPHRAAPMVFGRNEECGLRCVYHGWKFDVSGAATEIPAEPADSVMKNHVRIKAYPCVERNGIVWAYMGPDSEPPPLPMMEWNLVPDENVVVSMRVQQCNWLQALEGELDSAHAAILHGRIDGQGVVSQWVAGMDLAPKFECVTQDFGLSIAAQRVIDHERHYWRVNQFLLPFYSLVPPQSKFPELSGHAWVPIDDEHTLCLMFSYTPAGPLYDKAREIFTLGHKGRESAHGSEHVFAPRDMTTPYAKYWPRYDRASSFGFDSQLQRDSWFSGLPGLWVQDAACQSGVSPIADRSRERLGASDTGIIAMRRLLLETLDAVHADGGRPATVDSPDSYMVRALSLTLPAGQPWAEQGDDLMVARLGADFGYQP